MEDNNNPPVIAIYNPNDYLPSSSEIQFDKLTNLPTPVSSSPSIITPELKELSSSSTIIPPAKKPRLSSQNASEIGITFTLPSKKVELEDHEGKSYPDLVFDDQYIPSELNLAPEDILFSYSPNAGSEDESFIRQYSENNSNIKTDEDEPVYTVSGTQQLESDETVFNLHLEFPIPDYFAAYKSGRWKKVKRTSCTGIIENRDIRTNLKSVGRTQKGRSVLSITGRRFKRPIYMLAHIPLIQFKNKFLMHVSLTMADYNSQMELNLTEIDELLRGHPPTKKIKLDESCKLFYKDSQMFKFIEKPDVEGNESSVDFLFGTKPCWKRRKLSSNLNLVSQDKNSSSETEDEMKTILEEIPDMNEKMDSRSKVQIHTKKSSSKVNLQQNQCSVMRSNASRSRTIFQMMLKQTFNSKVYPEQKLESLSIAPKQQARPSKSEKFFKRFPHFSIKSFVSFKSLKKSTHLFPENSDAKQSLSITEKKNESQSNFDECDDDSTCIYVNHKSSSSDHDDDHNFIKLESNRCDKDTLTDIPSLMPDFDNIETENAQTAKSEVSKPSSIRIVASYQPFQTFLRKPILACGRNTFQNVSSLKCQETLLSNTATLSIHVPKINANDEKEAYNKTISKPHSLFDSLLEKFRNSTSKSKTKSQFMKSKKKESQLSPQIQTTQIQGVINTKSTASKCLPKERQTSENAKKVSFLHTMIAFFRRKEELSYSPCIEQKKSAMDSKSSKLKGKDWKLKLQSSEKKVDKNVQVLVLPMSEDKKNVDDFAMYQQTKHKDSVSIIRQKRMKLFEETREFYEDSITAYRKVLTQKAVAEESTPFSLAQVAPSTLGTIPNQGTGCPARLLLTSTQDSLGYIYKCTLSESIILPAISKRKRRLNQNFLSGKDSQEDQDILGRNIVASGKQLKGILKNNNPSEIANNNKTNK